MEKIFGIIKKPKYNRMNTKIVVFFNHKGGVSKTTTTYNVGWALANLGKKVLLVDGDPQCNLTGLILGDHFYDYYENKETAQLNVKDGVSVAFEGKPKPIQPIDCHQVEHNPNLYLIPGHMNLSEYESTLSLALNTSQTISTLQNLPGSFYELFRLCAEKYDIDYIFIDMNPGLSALNQTFFMSSDAFIIPTNPDPFSIMAIKTLNIILPRWKHWAENSRRFFLDASYPLPDVEMKFAGEIIQRYNKRNGVPVTAFASRIAEIKDYIESSFTKNLEEHNMIFDITNLIADNTITDYCLAEIPDFLSLLPKSQVANKPVFALNDSEFNSTGIVLEQDQKRRDEFKDVFNKISTIITRLVQ